MTTSAIVLDGVHRAGLSACDWSPSGRWIATGDTAGWVSFWDMSKGGINKRFSISEHKDVVQGIGFTSHDNYAVAGSQDGPVWLHQVEDEPIVPEHQLSQKTSSIGALRQSPDRQWTAMLDRNDVIVFNVFNADRSPGIIGKTRLTSFEICWHPDNRHLLVDNGLGQVAAWDIFGQKITKRFELGASSPSSIDVSPDGSKVMFCASGSAVEFDFQSERKIRSFGFGRDSASVIRYSPDQNRLLVGTDQRSSALLVTSLSGRSVISRNTQPQLNSVDISLSPDGKHVLLISDDRMGYVWEYKAINKRS